MLGFLTPVPSWSSSLFCLPVYHLIYQQTHCQACSGSSGHTQNKSGTISNLQPLYGHTEANSSRWCKAGLSLSHVSGTKAVGAWNRI
jgi:hypothetical protein